MHHTHTSDPSKFLHAFLSVVKKKKKEHNFYRYFWQKGSFWNMRCHHTQKELVGDGHGNGDSGHPEGLHACQFRET